MTETKPESGSKKKSKEKLISPREMHFCKLIAEVGLGGVEAARVAFGWRCEPDSAENQKARDLARSKRIKKEVERIRGQQVDKEIITTTVETIEKVDIRRIRDYAFTALEHIRDNPTAKAATRYQAIKILQRLHDPSKDVNLIWKWVDIAWRSQTAHCPACHKDFPLATVRNPLLKDWRARQKQPAPNTNLPDIYSCRMELFKRADKRRLPHPGQAKALAAPERHVVGQGAARAGKSYLLALFALQAFMLPGVEIWLLARTYEDARSEVEYMQKFLKSLFHPHEDLLVRTIADKKTGELTMISKWGSELRVRSAKAKGSITGRALELAGIAEPGWIEGEIYEELRARMSERLGRIVALGTPKGTAGLIGRLTKMTGRDPNTGKIVRRTATDRLIANGSDWNTSMLIYNLEAEDNPEYVKSEKDAARQELTDEEYKSEFEGIGVAAEGLKFSGVQQQHLVNTPHSFFDRSVFVLGIDQGPRNFGACLVAYDGQTIVPCWEYFNGDETTMKRNLLYLKKHIPSWIMSLGGTPQNWKLTITDRDPLLDGIFLEMGEEGLTWSTDIVVRHQNNIRMLDNWRRENQEFINNTARKGRLIFHESDIPAPSQDSSPGAYLLHDQMMNCADILEDAERESKSNSLKGWQVSDPWRGDHVLDAAYFAIWTICSGQLIVPERLATPESADDPWAEQKAAFAFQFAREERRQLSGGKAKGEAELFESHFGRKPVTGFITPGYYRDES